MTPELASALLPALRRVDPERAHVLALQALRLGLAGRGTASDNPALATTLLGRVIRNPIGLAAGFDKDGVAAAGLLRLGFGVVELGTVTPRPQAGNPKPRLFRLEGGAVINRMGFNNGGIEAFLPRLRALRPAPDVLVGANVGINKEGADPERDYPALVAAVAPHAGYVTLNVSSPNTAGLRGLQEEARLRAILKAVTALPGRPPVFVKIAPDLDPGALESIVAVAIESGIEGLIVSNTTVARPPELRGQHSAEAGGLSGPPLMAPSTAVLRRAAQVARGQLQLIGAGGVVTGADVLAKLRGGGAGGAALYRVCGARPGVDRPAETGVARGDAAGRISDGG